MISISVHWNQNHFFGFFNANVSVKYRAPLQVSLFWVARVNMQLNSICVQWSCTKCYIILLKIYWLCFPLEFTHFLYISRQALCPVWWHYQYVCSDDRVCRWGGRGGPEIYGGIWQNRLTTSKQNYGICLT
jgi:hypothetical protein